MDAAAIAAIATAIGQAAVLIEDIYGQLKSAANASGQTIPTLDEIKATVSQADANFTQVQTAAQNEIAS